MTTIRATRNPAWMGDGIDIRILDEEHRLRSAPIEMIPAAPGEYIPETIRLLPAEAQQLMDELWTAGLRPSEGTGSAGALAAAERHLNDMRKLAFHALKIK